MGVSQPLNPLCTAQPHFGAQNPFENLIKPTGTFPWKTKLRIIFPVQFQRIFGCLKLIYDPEDLMNFWLGLLTEHISNVQPDKGVKSSFLLTSCLSTSNHAMFLSLSFLICEIGITVGPSDRLSKRWSAIMGLRNSAQQRAWQVGRTRPCCFSSCSPPPSLSSWPLLLVVDRLLQNQFSEFLPSPLPFACFWLKSIYFLVIHLSLRVSPSHHMKGSLC